jgi:predicted Zn-dependent protease
VIGHEITHAAHRHSAAQQEIAKRGNPIAMPWNRAGRMARYGRDMERDADKGGQILCAAAGYDPIGMSTFLANLGQMERLKIGYSRGTGFFDSHPGSTERAAINSVRASEMRWTRDPAIGDPRASFLRQIDGLAIDQRPEAGVFVGDDFLHPDLDFRIRFPRGWAKQNSGSAVGAIAPPGDAVIVLQADMPKGEPREMAEQWVAKTRDESPIKVRESKPVKVGHLDAWRVKIDASSGAGALTSYVTFIPYRDLTWRISGMTLAYRAEKYQGRTLGVARSFRPLTEEERNSIDVLRLHTTTAYPGESLEAVNRRSGSAWDTSFAAIYNGVFFDHRFEGGELVKFAALERYVPEPLTAEPSSEGEQTYAPRQEGAQQ